MTTSAQTLWSDLDATNKAGDLAQVQSLLPQWRDLAMLWAADAAQLKERLNSLLIDAARKGHASTVSYLLSEGVELTTVAASAPIQYGTGSTQVFQAFLEHGWDINSDDPLDRTALIQALCKMKTDLVVWLLDHGANPNARGGKKRENLRVRKSVFGTPIKRVPLDFAAAFCPPDQVQLLLDRGAKLEKSNALHAAAAASGPGEDGQPPMIEFLLDLGMDINAIEFQNDEALYQRYSKLRWLGTPLHYAARWGRVDSIKCLLERGADRGAKGSSKSGTPLDWAKRAVMEREEDPETKDPVELEKEEEIYKLLGQ